LNAVDDFIDRNGTPALAQVFAIDQFHDQETYIVALVP
jgi:hypothetical protein